MFDDVLGDNVGGGVAQDAFILEHIEAGATDLSAIERFAQRLRVDERAAGGVDDQHATFASAEGLAIEQVVILRGERGVQRDDVRPREQIIELYELEIQFARQIRGRLQ